MTRSRCGRQASLAQPSAPALRVLGIDPGSRTTGFGIVDSRAADILYVEHGCLRLPRADLARRLSALYAHLSEVIERLRPEVVAIEKVFMARNAQSALLLGQARGAAVVAAANCGVDVVEYSALEVKQAVVGRGRADKQQVQHMVRVLLGLAETPSADAADALACAICHINTAHTTARRKQGLGKVGIGA